jgi:RNA polymerase sigma-70 factor (ECF subfamily)
MQHIQKEADAAIWSRLCKGDPIAFEKLFEKYWQPLFLYTYRVINNKDDAQDIVQQLLGDIWEKSSQLDSVSDVAPYLFRSLKNRILNHLRSSDLQAKHYSFFQEVLQQEENTHEDLVSQQSAIQHLMPLIQSLPEKMQTVVVLHYVEEKPIYEIAEKLGLAPQTIRNQLNIAIKRLRSQVIRSLNIVLIISILCL